MIAKITRGSNPGNIGAYLHGPGHSNEHSYQRGGRPCPGGVVVGGNLFVDRDTDEVTWVKEMRAAMRTRPEITKPIWQASLRNTATDRRLTDAEWAQAGQAFAESMGFAEHPWVMVRHADDHVHVVVCRVSDEGQVWHGRNDRRAAQNACMELERAYELEAAPRRREAGHKKRTVASVRDQQHKQAQAIVVYRAEIERARQHVQHMNEVYRTQRPTPTQQRLDRGKSVQTQRPRHLGRSEQRDRETGLDL